MKKIILIFSSLLLLSSCSRPSPEAQSKLVWWQEARYGMFVHWGISSLMGQEISWSRAGYGAARYDSLALRFDPVDFDADKWIDVAQAAGMKYIVLTTKHHDGFCLWDSKVNSFNIMNTPYHKDVCRQLADAAHRRGMRLGWYFSVREWSDENCCTEGKTDIYVEKMKEELKELLTNYGKIDILWFDFEGCPGPVKPDEIVSLITSLQPDIVYNNRLYPFRGEESHCCVGDYGMFSTPEQCVGEYGEIPWETCSTMASSRQWSIRFDDTPRSADDLIWETMGAAGGNGNILMNVGPDSLGVIPPAFAKRLAEVGDWIKAHDGILYGTYCGPWKPTADYLSTMKGKDAWLLLREGSAIDLPYSDELKIKKIATDDGAVVPFSVDGNKLHIALPDGLVGKRNVALKVSLKSADIKPLAPFSTTSSLAYGKPITASSSMSELYSHCPSSAVDDNDNTIWMTGRRADADNLYGAVDSIGVRVGRAFQPDATLEVDLEEERTVSSFRIAPSYADWGTATLEYKSGDEWIPVATNESFTDKWKDSIPQTKARYWRLSLHGGTACSGISEFQLFE